GSLFLPFLTLTIYQVENFHLIHSFPNLVLTPHHAFFTREALNNIANTTLMNISDIESSRDCKNQLQ
ncbi:MAG: 2-hydroxyacid dehydrogenase, partial [Phormidesmis sp.]